LDAWSIEINQGKKLKKFFAIFYLLFSIVSFAQNNKLPEWIKGNWVNDVQQPSVFETWEKVNDNNLKGISFSIVKADTVVFENMEILFRNDSTFFTTVVSNQNNGNKIIFNCTKMSSNAITFENSKHDFPTKICYTRLGNDSLIGKISGVKHGNVNEITFPMKKVK
jgi:hypothetical protein